jgi:hypothetical protein
MQLKFTSFFILVSIVCYSQNALVKPDSIVRIDTSKILALKPKEPADIMPDVCALGLGFGLDYGGLGINFTAYPHKYVGIFAGGGIAFAGFGYNVGAKIRFVKTSKKKVQVIPFAVGMYGYNTAILVVSNPANTGTSSGADYSKLFYGPSFGFGADIRFRKGYISLSLLFPIRGDDVDNYITDLQNKHHVTFQNDLLPVAFSIGYRFVLN